MLVCLRGQLMTTPTKRIWVVRIASFFAPIAAGLAAYAFSLWWRHALPFAVALGLLYASQVVVCWFLVALSWWGRRTKVTSTAFLGFVFDVAVFLFLVNLGGLLKLERPLPAALAQIGMGRLPTVLFAASGLYFLIAILRARGSDWWPRIARWYQDCRRGTAFETKPDRC